MVNNLSTLFIEEEPIYFNLDFQGEIIEANNQKSYEQGYKDGFLAGKTSYQIWQGGEY